MSHRLRWVIGDESYDGIGEADGWLEAEGNIEGISEVVGAADTEGIAEGVVSLSSYVVSLNVGSIDTDGADESDGSADGADVSDGSTDDGSTDTDDGIIDAFFPLVECDDDGAYVGSSDGISTADGIAVAEGIADDDVTFDGAVERKDSKS